MVDQTTSAFFELLYDMTYNQTVLFVTKRCGDPAQVSDIVQEIYADVFTALVSKDLGYMKTPGAFVRHVAKKKLARYYDWKSRNENLIPLFRTSPETDEEYEIISVVSDESPIDVQVENKLLLFEIAQHVAAEPADVGRIFLLHYTLDMPIRQIAKELGLKESTVKTKLYRTIAKLREIYQKDGIMP